MARCLNFSLFSLIDFRAGLSFVLIIYAASFNSSITVESSGDSFSINSRNKPGSSMRSWAYSLIGLFCPLLPFASCPALTNSLSPILTLYPSSDPSEPELLHSSDWLSLWPFSSSPAACSIFPTSCSSSVLLTIACCSLCTNLFSFSALRLRSRSPSSCSSWSSSVSETSSSSLSLP